MASFGQHIKRIEGRTPKRVTWVCGNDAWLRAHTINLIDKLGDFPAMQREEWWVAFHDTDATALWSSINQFTLGADTKRLIKIHWADRITDWAPLIPWMDGMREQPGVYLVFDVAHNKIMSELEHVAAIRDRGDVIACGVVKPEDLYSWLTMVFPSLSTVVVNRVIEHSHVPKQCWTVCSKLKVFEDPQPAHVDGLMVEDTETNFVDALTRIDKEAALALAPKVEVSTAVGLLSTRLDQMGEMLRAVRTNTTPDVPRFIVSKFSYMASSYTWQRIAECRRVLTVVDAALARGETKGAAEVLVMLW